MASMIEIPEGCSRFHLYWSATIEIDCPDNELASRIEELTDEMSVTTVDGAWVAHWDMNDRVIRKINDRESHIMTLSEIERGEVT